ncbi:MAG: DNA polymerase III subunit [Candidatus Aminicenantia bacterium]
MGIRTIENNHSAKKNLLRALENGKIAYTLLLKGKISDTYFTAIQIAKALNCKNPTPDSCDRCDACIKIERGVHPDIITVEPEGSFIKISQIRRIIELSSLKPMIGKKRVFILKRAELMNEEASNAFLKSIEEPSSHSHFIFLTENPDRIIPTIKSRCLQIEIFASRDSFAKKLFENGINRIKAIFLSELFENDYEKAISNDLKKIFDKRDTAFKVINEIIGGEYSSSLSSLLLELEKKKNLSRADWNSEVELFLKIILTILMDLMRVSIEENLSLRNFELSEKMVKLKGRLKLEEMLNLSERIDFLRRSLDKNVNINLFPYILFIELKEGLK